MSTESSLSFMDHLVELRYRIMRSLWAILAGMVVCYNFSGQIFDIIRAPIQPYLTNGGLVFTSPLDKFVAHLKIDFFGGIVLTCPFWIYQLWKFLSPGLYDRERRFAFAFIGAGTSLFAAGVCFAYFLVLPMAFQFLMTFGGDTDKPMITIEKYLSFFVNTSLGFGLSFEMPLVITLLGMLGIVSQQFLREKRRYAVLIIAIVSAIITPPDLISMLIMLVPMLLLYELSILAVGFVAPKNDLDLEQSPTENI